MIFGVDFGVKCPMHREILPTFRIVPCTQTDLWRIRARWPDGRHRQVKGVGFTTTRECWQWVRLHSGPWIREHRRHA